MNDKIQGRLFWLLIFTFAIFCISIIVLMLNIFLLVDKVRILERQGMFLQMSLGDIETQGTVLSTSVQKLNSQLMDLELIETYYEENYQEN